MTRNPEIRRILVTGASGKIGRSLLPALVADGYAVRATRFQTPVELDGVEVAQGSMTDRDFLREAVRDVDAVCHLATCKEDRERFIDVSVRGTVDLLDACRDAGAPRFLLASGDAALGIFFYPQPIPLDENAPLKAYPGYYALSKVLEETMCNQYAIQYGLPVTILRCSWIQDEDDILAYMTLQPPDFGGPAWRGIATTDEQRAYFDGGRDAVGCLRHPDGAPYVRHLVGVRDVVQAFRLALERPQAIGRTFNIAAPAPFSYDVLSRYIGERLGAPVVDFELDGFHDFAINISKARSVLGYRPEFDTFAMVERAIEFRKAGGARSPVKYVG